MPRQRDDQLTAAPQSLLKYRRSKNWIEVEWQWKSTVWVGNNLNLRKKITIVCRINENFAIFGADGWTRLRAAHGTHLNGFGFETLNTAQQRSRSIYYLSARSPSSLCCRCCWLIRFRFFLHLHIIASSQLNFYFRLSRLQPSRGVELSRRKVLTLNKWDESALVWTVGELPLKVKRRKSWIRVLTMLNGCFVTLCAAARKTARLRRIVNSTQCSSSSDTSSW